MTPLEQLIELVQTHPEIQVVRKGDGYALDLIGNHKIRLMWVLNRIPGLSMLPGDVMVSRTCTEGEAKQHTIRSGKLHRALNDRYQAYERDNPEQAIAAMMLQGFQ